jgi:predicted Zn-dependent protease
LIQLNLSAIEPPDRHYVKAAEGWLQLGNAAEAKQELARVSPVYGRHPAVLNLSWQVYAQEKNWDRCLSLATALIEVAPDRPSGWIHRSYALHEMKRTQEAWDQLFPIKDRFPEDPTIPYNLACYACQLRQLDTARQWLKVAMRIGDLQRIIAMALADQDLSPLWPELSAQAREGLS